MGLKAESKSYNQTSVVAGIRAEGDFQWAAGKKAHYQVMLQCRKA